MLSISDRKPPYVQFEMRAVEDRAASEKAGRKTYRDVAFALVSQVGSRDITEKVAEEWLDQQKRRALNGQGEDGMWEQKLYDHFTSRYKMWKEGQEIPDTGSPLRASLLFTPSEIKACLDAGIRTLEDLAGVSEEGMGRIGMGARALKSKANDALASAKDIGKTTLELESLRIKNEELATRNQSLEGRISALETLLAEKRKPGRPRNEVSEAA